MVEPKWENTEHRKMWAEIKRLRRRCDALEAHVERLESDCAPAPDSCDLRPALPTLGDSEDE